MKKITTAIITGLLGAAACHAAAPRFSHAVTAPGDDTSAPAPRWAAQTLTAYSADDNGVWEIDYTSAFTYDREANPLVTLTTSADGPRTREVQTFDSCDRYLTKVTEVEQGLAWIVADRTEREFDEATGLVVRQRATHIVDGTETLGSNYNRIITRDERGRITAVEIQVPNNGVYETTERLVLTYGQGDDPSEILATSLNANGRWIEGGHFTDLVWDRCDCQVSSLEGLFQGANRILSGHYVERNGTRPYYDYDITASYTEGSEDFTVSYVGLIQGYARSGRVASVRHTDENGSYMQRTEYYSLAEGSREKELSEFYLQEVRYDAYGNDILNQLTYWDSTDPSARTVEERLRTDVVYDETHGYPLSLVLYEYDPESRKDIPMIKIEYADYVDASALPESGIADVDIEAAPQQWFDLSGRPVASPHKGIYILRKGNNSFKVII